MQRRNNLVVGYVLAMAAFVAAMFIQWFLLPKPVYNGLHLPSFVGPLEVSGLSGSITLVGISLRIWFLLCVSIVATAIGILNFLNITSISKLLVVLALVLPALFYLFPLVMSFEKPAEIEVHAGPVLALLASVGAIWLVGRRVPRNARS